MQNKNQKLKIKMSSPIKYKRTFDLSELETIKLIQAFVDGTVLKLSSPVFSGSGDAEELDHVLNTVGF